MQHLTWGEPRIERLRRLIEEAYRLRPTSCGGSFGELLCYEIHERGMTFEWLARKWGVSLATLGDLISDHCHRLEEDPKVRHVPEGPCLLTGDHCAHFYRGEPCCHCKSGHADNP